MSSETKPAAAAAPDPDVRVAATGDPEWYHEGKLVEKDQIVAVTPAQAKRLVDQKAARKV